MRRDTYESHKWNSSLEIYADKRGQLFDPYDGAKDLEKGLVKLSIGLGKGKKKFDKREVQKLKDWNKSKQRIEQSRP